MSASHTNRQRVKVDGRVLKQDRIDLGHTRESLVALATQGNQPFSASTLQRAENSARIEVDKLKPIAATLGQPYERYVFDPGEPPRVHFVPKLEGRWRAMFVEVDVNLEPYIVEEVADISQSRDEVHGKITVESTKSQRTEIVRNGLIVRDLFWGEIYVAGWTLPTGLSQFQLLIQHGDEFMDGVTSWYDKDSRQIEWSRYVWIREGCMDERLLLAKARDAMRLELKAFKGRRKKP